jgi:hypothetical protein
LQIGPSFRISISLSILSSFNFIDNVQSVRFG